MKKSLSPLIAALLLAALPTVAWADADDRVGAYGVVGLGKGKVTAKGNERNVDKTSKNIGSSKLAYTLGAGYRINEYLAIESDFSGTFKGKQKSATSKGKKSSRDGVSSRALTVSALGIIPVGDHVELFGRAGIGQMQTRFTPATGSEMSRIKSRGMAAVYGVGANVDLTGNSFLRTEYSVMRSKKGNAIAKERGGNRLDNSQLTLSYGYNF